MPKAQVTVYDGSKTTTVDTTSPYSMIVVTVDGVDYRITPQRNSIQVVSTAVDYPGLSIHPSGTNSVLVKAEESSASVLRRKMKAKEAEIAEREAAADNEHPLKWAYLSSDEAHELNQAEQERLPKSSNLYRSGEAEDYSEDRRRRLCGDYPAPCNCDDPDKHNGH